MREKELEMVTDSTLENFMDKTIKRINALANYNKGAEKDYIYIISVMEMRECVYLIFLSKILTMCIGFLVSSLVYLWISGEIMNLFGEIAEKTGRIQK